MHVDVFLHIYVSAYVGAPYWLSIRASVRVCACTRIVVCVMLARVVHNRCCMRISDVNEDAHVCIHICVCALANLIASEQPTFW